MHPLVQLAKETVELYIKEKKCLEVRDEDVAEEFRSRSGVFVCLKIAGMLRGCIGTFQPTEPSIARNNTKRDQRRQLRPPHSAVCALTNWIRIEYTVDVLTAPEPVKDRAELDPRRYGVIVQAGKRRGLLFPTWKA